MNGESIDFTKFHFFQGNRMMQKIKHLLSILGPGIFAIGYTIGTGSVTSMAKAGSQYGLQLVWVLALSCLFSGILMEAYGRLEVVTGETALYAIKRHLRWGKPLAVLIFIGVVMGQYTCLGSILTLSSGAIYETLGMFFPSLPKNNYGAVLAIAIILIGSIYGMLMIGRYGFFEKVLAFFVMLMGITFLISMFVVWPSPEILKQAVLPSIPDEPGALLMIAAFVGTTMAAPTFVTRPLLLKEKGLTCAHLREQRLDAIVSATLMFVISGSIMVVAAGALYAHGKDIVKILDMVHTLEPVAGKFAVALFMAGTLSAGLSSIFPILMVAPLLVSDYQVGHMEPRSRSFKVLCLVASLFGLIVPLLGRNPITITVMAQISNVFVLPLTVLVIHILINRRSLLGEHRAGIWLNIGLALAFFFSCVIAITGALALCQSHG
jgi:Mn2+/Fe2+ NRAMP family transporter